MTEMFGNLFDLDHDGDIGPLETGVGLLFLDDLLKDEKKRQYYFYDKDEDDFEDEDEDDVENYLFGNRQCG